MSLKQHVLATMKSEDTESAFELYVTRTPGYLWALLFKALHVTPLSSRSFPLSSGPPAAISSTSTTCA